MIECNSTVMWIALLYEYVTIETTHLRNVEDTNTTE